MAQFEGKYELLEKLREGGMGAIYKVRHTLLNQVRVIKVIRPQLTADKEAQRRFVGEAKLATRLSHPNLAAFLDFAEDAERNLYLVMEYVEGVNLREYVYRAGRPPLRTSLEIALQTLSALAYLHQEKVVHRDVSPDNLMLMRDRHSRLVVKLIDLGLAKDTDAPDATVSGTFVGKLRFASPEQLQPRRSGPLDGRSDLYSFGCVLYWLCTGMYPFNADSFSEYVALHLMHPPLGFDESDPEGRVPEPLRQVVMRCLAKPRDERWPSADELAQRLRGLIGELGLGELVTPSADWLRPEEPLARSAGDSDAASRVALAFPAGTPSPDRGFSSPEIEGAEGSTLELSPAPEPKATMAAPPPAARGSRRLLLSLVSGGLIAAALLLRGRAPAAPVPAPFGRVVITAEPWARLAALEGLGETATPPQPGRAFTPAAWSLPPGRYRLRLEAGAFGAATRDLDVRASETAAVHLRMPEFRLEEAVAAYAR